MWILTHFHVPFQLIAAATIYLATKVKDEPVNIRDLVSVIHCTLNRTIEPPEKDREFWLIRDAIVQAELLVTRMLKFDLNSAVHPHKVNVVNVLLHIRFFNRPLSHLQYLLHYMKFLADWFGPVWTTMPIAKTAAGFLQDFYHSPEILNFKPTHVAICCLSLALQIYGLQVPVRFDADPEQWYSAFVDDDLSKEKHWAICEKILAVYDHQDMGLPANQSMMRQGHEYQKQLTD